MDNFFFHLKKKFHTKFLITKSKKLSRIYIKINI